MDTKYPCTLTNALMHGLFCVGASSQASASYNIRRSRPETQCRVATKGGIIPLRGRFASRIVWGFRWRIGMCPSRLRQAASAPSRNGRVRALGGQVWARAHWCTKAAGRQDDIESPPNQARRGMLVSVHDIGDNVYSASIEGDFYENFNEHLNIAMIPSSSIQYHSDKISFEAGTRDKKFIVPLILEVKAGSE